MIASHTHKDGYYRASFKGFRANNDCTSYESFVFSEPSDGDGECGVIRYIIEKGHHDDEKCKKRPCDDDDDEPAWKKSKTAGVVTGSSSVGGEVCTGRGSKFSGTGFRDIGQWVTDPSSTCHGQVYYTADP